MALMLKLQVLGQLIYQTTYMLKDVLCVPSFHVNLLFVSQLTSALNCSIHFFPTFCVLQDLAMKRMIGLGKQYKGLYDLEPHSELLSSPPKSYQVSSPSTITWHQRLGHPSKAPSQLLSQKFPYFMFDSQHSCEICPLTKQTRFFFLLVQFKACIPLILFIVIFGVPSNCNSHRCTLIFDNC